MESVAKLVSLAAATSLVCAAAFLYGDLSVLKHLDLVWYLTFSDFVNFTPAVLLVQGISLGIMALQEAYFFSKLATTDVELQRINRKVAYIIGLPIVVAFSAGVWFGAIPSNFALAFVSLGLLTTLLTARVRPTVANAYGEFGAFLFDRFLTLIFIAALCGYLWSLSQSREHHIVCTADGNVIADVVLPMDRGIAIISPSNYKFIPWANVKSVREIDDDIAKGLQKLPMQKLCS